MSDDFDLEPQPQPVAKTGWRRFVPSWPRSGSSDLDDGPSYTAAERSRIATALRWGGGVLLVLILLYYPIGAVISHKINDDPAFTAPAIPAEASQTVAMASALLDREVNGTTWPANSPWFFPGAILDNMPNFQSGEIQALQRVVTEFRDQIGRARGTSSADRALQDAAAYLNNQPDIWYIDLSRSWAPMKPSESYYNDAIKALNDFNGRLTRGDAVFERRADNLLSTLDRIGKDLGAASDDIDREIDEQSGSWFDLNADDVFYRNKGELYAYGLLLKALGQDFRQVLTEKGAVRIWDRMVGSMMEGAVLQPWFVINGETASMMQPNHLAEQGFYLLRARAQLEEITDILQK
ncbi:DUF2333 family protein [Dongia rigui]|uniref:DUF2333 family protein n=1 Tax=Dongia rigui TaxID=940149 RepID=A0ABU5DX59_9PROT|nr:DUF2333 family protein [Dongia rigui]MDY0871885.1 DUF2333 family protein [Dongia rigui]